MSIPSNIKELLLKLEYLGMIEKNKKPCLRDMTFVDSNSWSGAYKRSRNSENKNDLLHYIDSLLDQVFTAIDDSRNRDYVPLLVSALIKARTGINNTQVTYKSCPSYLSAVRVTLQNIDMQLKRFGADAETY